MILKFSNFMENIYLKISKFITFFRNTKIGLNKIGISKLELTINFSKHIAAAFLIVSKTI